MTGVIPSFLSSTASVEQEEEQEQEEKEEEEDLQLLNDR